MINFCHISPTPHLNDFAVENEVHLLLAHLVEVDNEYTEWYKQCQDMKILDNSAFEMYKQGRPMYESSKLLEMAGRVEADVIVMSDYPGQSSQLTIDAAEKLGPEFHDAGYKTFFVPQSQIGDMDDYLHAFEYAVASDNVDFVGVSILGVPNAFGNIEKENKLQRFLSRWKMLQLLDERGLLEPFRNGDKHMHFLGALDGWSGEAELVRPYHDCIFSWDSSGAVYFGLHGNQEYDNSPTGQLLGKYEIEVDFNFHTSDPERIRKAHANIARMNATVR
jgi:hypothetical protein